MALAVGALALMIGSAAAAQLGARNVYNSGADFSANVSRSYALSFMESYSQTMAVATLSGLAQDAPEWCKIETNLTWMQRKERMMQRATLDWARKEVKQLRAANQTIPEWMDKLVRDDEDRGRMRWAVEESKRLQIAGKEVPSWMADLVSESQKWANRWAACKCAELRAMGEEVPAWMVENGRKGVMEYANQKADEIQGEIDALEQEKSKEESLIQSAGDEQEAANRMLAQTRNVKVRSLDQQLQEVEKSLKELEQAEQELKSGADVAAKVKKAMLKVREATGLLKKIMAKRAGSLRSKM